MLKIMKRKASLIFVVAGCVTSLVVFAEQRKQSKEDETIEAVVRRMYSIKSTQDFRQVISGPYLAISVRAKGAKPMVFRDKADLDEYVKGVEDETKRLEQEPPTIGGPVPIVPIVPPEPQLSQITVTKLSATVAYVSYTLNFKPNPSKRPPVPLLCVLRKEQNSWKIVFNTFS
jgi:hypothetical protein